MVQGQDIYFFIFFENLKNDDDDDDATSVWLDHWEW